MENKINVAELLKDCPKGMELDCTVFKGLEFDHIDKNNETYPIICRVKTEWGSYNIHTFTKYGCYSTAVYSKCVIFPKGKKSWTEFIPLCQFKDGDIVATTNSFWIGITKGGKSDTFIPTYCVIKRDGKFEAYFDREEEWQFTRFATEEEKQKLFDAIKANGYKWNAETKTLDKLPKFKVDDKIKLKGGDEFGIITQVSDCFYTIKCKNNTHYWSIKKQDDWELINEPKFKVGDIIKPIFNKFQYRITELTDTHYTLVEVNYKYKYTEPIIEDKNWTLVSIKFDINTLKSFDKVLVRSSNNGKWGIDFFGGYSEGFYYTTGNCMYVQCIPYEGNEHLRGTTNDCDDFYKTWE